MSCHAFVIFSSTYGSVPMDTCRCKSGGWEEEAIDQGGKLVGNGPRLEAALAAERAGRMHKKTRQAGTHQKCFLFGCLLAPNE